MSLDRRDFLKTLGAGALLLTLPVSLFAKTSNTAGGLPSQDRPNILWLVSEDNSPTWLGCYSNELATTPNLDKLAEKSIVYDRAFSNASVCAPARNTLITGMFASSTGCFQMRSNRYLPSFVKGFPEYLRKAGYYTTNYDKTDYNTPMQMDDMWDECNKYSRDNFTADEIKGILDNRKPGQPFFSVFNFIESHEHRLHNIKDSYSRNICDPAKVTLPPYYPDIPAIRQTMAKQYDVMTTVDDHIGQTLKGLKESGQEENTIIFYYGDNGGVMPPSKRLLHVSGTRVPLIIHFPQKWKHLAPTQACSRTDRMVDFVDFAPTILSLAGVKIPDYMQGKAFLGKQQSKPQQYSYQFIGRVDERYQSMRAICDKKYYYLRNFMPHRPAISYVQYLFASQALQGWYAHYKQGRCNELQSRFFKPQPTDELYDMGNDPHQINNLAASKDHLKVLKRMRKALISKMTKLRDAAILPEAEMIDRTTIDGLSIGDDQNRKFTVWDLTHDKKFPYQRALETMFMATARDTSKLPALIKRMKDRETCIRYWAAMGCVVLGDEAKPAILELAKLLKDPVADVRIAAAEALLGLGRDDEMIVFLMKECQKCSDSFKPGGNYFTGLAAANVLFANWGKCIPYAEDVKKLTEKVNSHQGHLNNIMKNLDAISNKISTDGFFPATNWQNKRKS